uniref:RING finger protein 207 n=1 Tax=Erpetoichthys calabaricus TaxID=27687 RepID=A0A8C4S1S2_ERPCA
MSGGIFSPMDSFFNIDSANCHPLVCHLCHEQYEHPCLLDCYHTFCASCLRGRAVDSRLSCPLCGHQSIVKGSNGLPPEDRLLNSWWTTLMYYCNTCNQPLCGTCREDTHKAKMFSRHEIVSLAKRTKEIHKKCSLHEELYIMFSTEKKSMLCINCFRDMQVESRAHCIDIETAYMQGCEKLDQAVMAVKELQTSAREAIILLKAMIGEVRTNVDEEESAISTLFNNMQEKLAERKKILLKAAQSQHEEKERAFKEQLSHLSALLPTLQVHLVTCSAFLSSANKFEFLDLGYVSTFAINTDYRSEFARCLEPLLILNHRRSVSLTGNTSASSLVGPCHSPSTSDMSLSASVVRKPTSHRYISTKVLLAEGTETSFTEHCRNYENTYRTLQTEIQKLKDQVQEIHRDLDQKSLQIDVQIASEYSSGGDDEDYIWEETLQRVANEQEIYEAQLHDLLQLKQENSYLTTITKQIGPYIRSIAKNVPIHQQYTNTHWSQIPIGISSCPCEKISLHNTLQRQTDWCAGLALFKSNKLNLASLKLLQLQ